MSKKVIKSCSHCGSIARVILEGLGNNKYLVGWECTGCRESVSTVCVHDMIDYNVKKMGQQWNMRAALNEENYTSYSGF